MAVPPVGGTTQVTVDPHDTLSEIAAENNISLNKLLELNPQFDASKVDGRLDAKRTGESGWDPDFIRPGDTIIVPKKDASPQTEPTSTDQGTTPTVRPVSNNTTKNISSQTANGNLDLKDVYERYRGGNYVFGGGRDGNGLGAKGAKNSDCSAFVSAVWNEKGLKLAAHTDGAYTQLKNLGAKTTTGDPKAGDVVFWMGAGSGGKISHHMGIYMGDGKVLQQTIANGGGVQILAMPTSAIEILRDPRMNPTMNA